MSFPPPTPEQPDLPPYRPSERVQRRPPRRLRSLLLLALAAALVGACITQVPREIGRWHLAAALHMRAEEKKEAAYRELAAAMARFPDNPQLLLQRAQWRLEDGQEKAALEDCDRAVEVAKDNIGALQLRGTLLLNAGHFRRAVDDFKKVERDSRRTGYPPREDILNELAYAEALANVDLDDALSYANRAIEILSDPKSIAASSHAVVTYKLAQTLDTRGFILHLLSRDEQALADLDQSIERLKEVRRELGKDTDILEEVRKAEPSKKSKELTGDARNAAVMHYHRSLVLLELGRKEDAEKDLAIARELIGREPDEKLF